MILGLELFIYFLQQWEDVLFPKKEVLGGGVLKAGVGAKAPSVIWFRRLVREWKLKKYKRSLIFFYLS